MALLEYQTALNLNTLYEIKVKGGVSGKGNTLNPSIWANALISIYGSDSATQPANLADMTLSAEETDVEGKLVLGAGVSSLPRYIAITGTATEVVASGVEFEDLGAIS